MVGANQLSSLGLKDGTGDQQVEVVTWKTSPEDLRKKKGCYKSRLLVNSVLPNQTHYTVCCSEASMSSNKSIIVKP